MALTRRTPVRSRFPNDAPRTHVRIVVTACAALLIFLFLGWVALQKPRTIECITNEFTYCDQEMLDALSELKNMRFFLQPQKLRAKESELLERFPNLIEAKLQRTLTGGIQATITLAQPLLAVVVNQQPYFLRENGYLTPHNGEPNGLLVELQATISAQRLLEPWDASSQKSLAVLTQSLEHFRPRIKKVVAIHPQEIIAYPEGNGPIFLRVDQSAHVPEQLSTLQAFFRSTTMDTPYRELDARFSQLVVKE